MNFQPNWRDGTALPFQPGALPPYLRPLPDDAFSAVHLYGPLAERFGETHTLMISSPAEAIRALSALYPGFYQAIAEGKFRIVRGTLKQGAALEIDQLQIGMGGAELHIVPVVEGSGFFGDLFDKLSGGGLGTILAGIAIIAAAFIFAPAGAGLLGAAWGATAVSIGGTALLTYGNIALFGAGLVLAGASQLLSPTPKMVQAEGAKSQTTRLFGSVENVATEGGPVPLAYGRVLVGSTVISAGMDVDDGTKAYFNVVDLLCEGEIKGLADGEKSILLNGTPVRNADGSKNFDLEWSFRPGTSSQSVLSGFSKVENEVGVSAEIIKGTPLVRTVNDADVDRVRITISTPALFKVDKKNGKIKKTSVKLTVETQPFGGSYSVVREIQIEDKTQTPVQRQYTIERPAGATQWNIRIKRQTDQPDDNEQIQNRTYWVSYTLITDHKLTYPDSAVIGIRIPAGQFGGQIPSRQYIIDGRLVQVPKNYDPVTRSYTGAWDGAFKRAFTDNPAWVVWDLLTEKRACLGEYLSKPGLDIDKWSLYRIAQYCDELVPDGKGGFEPRYRFSGIITTQEEAMRVVAAVVNTFRGMIYFAAGSIFVTADMPEDPAILVTNANVIGGEFVYSGSGLKSRHSRAVARWFDPDRFFAEDVAVVDDQDAIDQFGLRVANVEGFGDPSRGQATRRCKWLLDTERNETITVAYSAAWDHCRVRPGQIVKIADRNYAGARFGGRVKATVLDANGKVSGVVLDQSVTLDPGHAYRIEIIDAAGRVEKRDVTNPPGATDTIDFASPLAVEANTAAVWLLSSTALEGRMFRVIAVRETEPHIVEVSALFHDPTKYARIEQGMQLELPNYTKLPTGPLEPPSGLTAKEVLYTEAGGATLKSGAALSWTPSRDQRVLGYEVEMKVPPDDDGTEFDFEPAGVTSGATEITIQDLDQGTYAFRVRAFSPGLKSAWVTLTNVLLDDLTTAPPDVQNFRVTVLGDIATLSWDRIDNLAISHYVVRYSPSVLSGITWGSAALLLPRVDGTSAQVPAQSGTYLVKAVSRNGAESVNPAIQVSNVAGITALNVVETYRADPDFDGTLTNVIIESARLRLFGSALPMSQWMQAMSTLPPLSLLGGYVVPEGLFEPANHVDLGEVLTSRVSARLIVTGANILNVMAAWAKLSDVETLAGTGSSAWATKLEVSYTADDPAAPDAEWTGWAEFAVGDFTARAFKFRLWLYSLSPHVTPVVESLIISIDVPDRVIADKNLTIPATGLRVVFDPPYRQYSGVGVAVALNPGERYVISNAGPTGFDIEVRDTLNNLVGPRSLSGYVAKGYGTVVVS